MVELVLDTADYAQFAKDYFVSVRVGEVQKLSKIGPSRSYKFPASAIGNRRYGKIEIFKRVGVGAICIDPESTEERYEIPVSFEGTQIQFGVGVSGEGTRQAEQRQEKPQTPQAEDKPPSDTNLKVAAAKDYLAQHHLEFRLSEAMQAVLRERPEDPATFVANKLLESKEMASTLPRPTSRPAQPNNGPPLANELPQATPPALEATPPAASPDAPGPEGHADWKQRPSVATWYMRKPKSKATPAQAKSNEDIEELRCRAASALLDASKDGRMLDVFQSMASEDVTALRTQVANTLVQASSDGRFAVALQEMKQEKPGASLTENWRRKPSVGTWLQALPFQRVVSESSPPSSWATLPSVGTWLAFPKATN